MAAPVTGVTSFDVPELLAPITHCLLGMQQQIIEEKLDMLDTLNKDPVPQYTLAQINKATVFLRDAKQAMRVFLGNFEPHTAERLDANTLMRNLETARESSRRLVLLFAEQQHQFSGSSLQGSLLRFSEGSQSQQVRDRLQSLSSFLSTFSQASWLGDMLQTPASSFQQEMELVTKLLNGLLNPKKTPCPPLDDELQKMTIFVQEAGCGGTMQQRVQQLRQRADLHASAADHDSAFGSRSHLDYRNRCRKAFGSSQTPRPQVTYSPIDLPHGMVCALCGQLRCRCSRPPAPTIFTPDFGHAAGAAVPNPLGGVEAKYGITGSSSCTKRVNCLSHMCQLLGDLCVADEQKKTQLQSKHKAKMEGLKELAKELNSVPGVLNQYLLVRLGDIDGQDLGQLKAWITHDQATQVHKMLESFRDEAIYERAMRDLSKRNRGASAREDNLSD